MASAPADSAADQTAREASDGTADRPADDGAEVPPSKDDQHGRRRPRPSAKAPAIYEPAFASAEPQPGDDFFSRTDDDDKHAADDDDDHDDQAAEKKPKKKKRRRTSIGGLFRKFRKLVVIVVIAVVAVLALRTYVVAPYYVPSASMEPTLHGCSGCNNDHVLVEKLSYRFHDVQPGDVVVFNRPSNWKVDDKVLIKRVIGISGDVLTIRDGHVYRSGKLLDEPYVNSKCKHGTTVDPTSPSQKRHIYKAVPNGQVFVMGDNRCDSDDSRVFGLVPTSKIIGRAFLIIYPFGRLHSL